MEEKQLKVIKIVSKDKKYKDAKGKEHSSVNYYLVFGTTYIAVRPCFSKGYTQLDCYAQVIVNGSDNLKDNKGK